METFILLIHHLAHLCSHMHDSASLLAVELRADRHLSRWVKQLRRSEDRMQTYSCQSEKLHACVWQGMQQMHSFNKAWGRSILTYCSSDITGQRRNNKPWSKRYYPWGCLSSGSKLVGMLTKSGSLFHFGILPLIVHYCEFSVCPYLLNVVSSKLLLDYYFYKTSAITSGPA